MKRTGLSIVIASIIALSPSFLFAEKYSCLAVQGRGYHCTGSYTCPNSNKVVRVDQWCGLGISLNRCYAMGILHSCSDKYAVANLNPNRQVIPIASASTNKPSTKIVPIAPNANNSYLANGRPGDGNAQSLAPLCGNGNRYFYRQIDDLGISGQGGQCVHKYRVKPAFSCHYGGIIEEVVRCPTSGTASPSTIDYGPVVGPKQIYPATRN